MVRRAERIGMTELDEALGTFAPPDDDWPPPVVVESEPRKCRRHVWVTTEEADRWAGKRAVSWVYVTHCARCPAIRDEAKSRRGKQSRNYGNRAELEAAKRYGGQKVGAAGGPVDIRGTDWNTQMKTHRRKPPVGWTTAFGKMAANRERMPRLLLRFVMGPGQPPQDYFVVRGEDWLAWHGKDGE